MTITFTQSDWEELWDYTQSQAMPVESDRFETVEYLPSCVGSGYCRSIELAAGMWLSLSDWNCDREWLLQFPDHDHPIQILILLSGALDTQGVHPVLDRSRGYFSGSGMSPGFRDWYHTDLRMMTVNVEIEPELLEPLFGEDTRLRSILCKEQEWKNSFYPTVNAPMRSIAQQIWDMPYHGAAKKMYLQAKAWELLAMQIDLVTADRFLPTDATQLRPDTIARLQYAREILTDRWEHPPLLSDLAQQVGISDRTLRRGFRELYQTTPLKYLTQQRMQQAQQLLESRQWSVAQVARMVGYGKLGHFSSRFKREFGINPSECLKK